MSVDTYLKGKNTRGYTPIEVGDVKVLVPYRLLRWAKEVRIDRRTFILWDSFDIEAEHRHTRACGHG